MTAGLFRGRRDGVRAALLAALLACGCAGEAAAQGARGSFFAAPSASPLQDFFSAIFGGGSRRSFGSRGGFDRPQIELVPGTSGGLPGGAAIGYCVRTCDGRYFPLQGRPAGAGDPNALAQCNAFCPAAKMAVYTAYDSAKGIDVAISKDGKAYSDLPNAYVYRQHLVDGCTCTASGRTGGLARIEVLRDPTLKRGDVVMTQEGSRVFGGAKSGPPFQQADFVSPSRFPELPRDMRARLNELTVATR